MIGAYYARVSTPGQEKEQTIKSQVDDILIRAKKDNNIIPQKFEYKDEGWSGDILARPELDRLRDDAAHKLFQVLYLWDRDRIARRYSYQEYIIDELQELGIQVIDLQSAPIRNSEDKILMGFKGLFAEYERLKITERMRRGKMFKAKSGVLFGWEAPYGYKYVKSEKINSGHFEIEEKEAEVVRAIFEWVGNEGLTVRQVIKRLFDQGICPRKSKKGYWSTSTLSKRLRDETYIGITHYNKTMSIVPKNPVSIAQYKRIKKSSRKMKLRNDWFAISVPQIIDKELFERTREQMIINSKFAMHNKKNKYLCANIIRCTCNSTRAGEGISGTDNLYYRCTNRVRHYPLPRQCFNKGVNAPQFDGIVWSKLAYLLSNPNEVKKYHERWSAELNTKPQENESLQIKVVESQIQALTKQEKRYLEAYGSGLITLDQYKEQSTAIKLKIQDYTSKLSPQKTTVEQKPCVIPDFEAVYDKMNETLAEYEFDDKRSTVREIVDDIVTDGITATMTGHLPLEIPSQIQKKCQVKNSVSVLSGFQT